jgi:hypothetical protein
VLAVLVVVSIYSMVTNEARPHEFSPPLNYVVGTGYAVSRATSTIALAFGVMLAGVFALSAVVDLVPAFRRRGAGAAFRRILWPIFKEPGTSPSRRR